MRATLFSTLLWVALSASAQDTSSQSDQRVADAGNAAELNPASDTPLSAWKMGELLLEAGVPASALHLLPGDDLPALTSYDAAAISRYAASACPSNIAFSAGPMTVPPTAITDTISSNLATTHG